METKTKLNDHTIERIQGLIRINIDSHKGFEEAADHVDDGEIAALFRNLSQERNQQVSELRTLVRANCEEAEDAGSMAGSAHRAWIDLRGAMGAGTQAMLDEAERGEDYIKEKYEEALKDLAGSALTDVLNRQYAAVKKAHDTIRACRDSYSESNAK